MTMKEQERKALEKIKKIVEDLGEQSYIGTAFAGCFDLAEQNIEYDAAFSLQDELKTAERERDKAISESKFYMEEHNKLATELEKVKAELDKELEWKDCSGIGTQMIETDYLKLKENGKVLTHEEAIDLLSQEFGFNPEKITIRSTVNTYESDKYSRARVKEAFVRDPVYCATDWNYIRFDCAGWYYEMINGQLKKYYC